jgi:hypothetical protein
VHTRTAWREDAAPGTWQLRPLCTLYFLHKRVFLSRFVEETISIGASRRLANATCWSLTRGSTDLAAVCLEGIQDVLDTLLVGFSQEVTANLGDDYAFAVLWRGG